MSGLQDVIRQRKRIRRFGDEPVPESKLMQVLDAGRWAISPGDIQPWRMIILSDGEIRAELMETMAEHLKGRSTSEEAKAKARFGDESLDLLSSAPILIVACMTKDIFGDQPDRWVGEHAMSIQSVAAAIQNMLLVAHDVGLGGCWSPAPLFYPTDFRRVLGIPQSVEPQAIVGLGYPEEYAEPSRRRPFEEGMYLDRWGRKYSLS
ncbi:hypothetical protein AC482_00090 [miscellaneous Crenarchaeota group-15 archaeon DG-45]|uniref:Nitroreductase domain-containing protein n=1 Tax=miscellaneous Crenarchaeota group-15 archaeon DG-45 TaxID=1685127 RepID=A0A0M0BTT5_9ARCH|nr:MAG: hypothetical protein AC482_00090 [miscellaneous Crenarchaeota group-15 archaeon DG-45]